MLNVHSRTGSSMQVPLMLKLLVAAAGIWSAAAAVAAVPSTLQPYAPCGSSACSHRPLTSSSQLAGQHAACQGASGHDSACPVGYSCQQRGNQAWLCLPAVAKEAGYSAADHLQATTQAAAGVQRRSLAQNPAVATRTTDTTVPGSSPTAGSSADSNSALAPRATGATAPDSNNTAGSNPAANPAVAIRTTDETVPSASSGSGTQATNAGSVGAAKSGAMPRALCAGFGLQWLASAVLLAVLLVAG